MTGGTKARMAVNFKTMYTCIPLDDLTNCMHKLIREVFAKRNQHAPGASGQPCQWLLQLGKSESKVGAERSAEAGYNDGQTVDTASLVFDALKAGCIHQDRQGCSVAKNRHPDGYQLRSILG